MPKSVIFSITPELLGRDGLTETPQPWEDGLRADTGRGCFEWWYFDAHLDDGSTAVIVYSTKPLTARNKPLTPFLQLAITQPDGVRHNRFVFFPPEAFSAARETCDVRIGPSRVRGSLQRYELHAEAEGLGADLILTGIVPPWRPGAGKSYYDRELKTYFGWLPAIPYGRVEGELTYTGKTVRVQGSGYHDHNWGNVNLGGVMNHWTWGRAQVGAFTLIFVEMVASRAYNFQRIPVFLLAQGDKILTGDGSLLSMQADGWRRHTGGRSYPAEVDFHWKKENESVHLRLREPQLIEAASLVGYLPTWQRKLAQLTVNPYYFRFNANLDLTVELAGVQSSEHGQALYELMLLR